MRIRFKNVLALAGVIALLAGCEVTANTGDQCSDKQASSTVGTSCKKSTECNDNNPCTVNVCVESKCAFLGTSEEIACFSPGGDVGMCLLTECVLASCSTISEGEPCFAEGGIGECVNSACALPEEA